MPIDILIADDHPIFLQGLRMVIELDSGLRVAAEAGDGGEALSKILECKPSLAILDVDMPVLDGFEVVRQARRHQAHLQAIFLTLYKDEMHLSRALELGANGYLIKDSASAEIVECIKTVIAGSAYITPTLATRVLRRQNSRFDKNSGLAALTRTERLILDQLTELKTNKEIAAELRVSVRTVENHRANICEKLNLQGTHALVRFAIEHHEKE